MGKKIPNVHLTAISTHRGIIKIIELSGSIGFYRQKGIEKLSDIVREEQVEWGWLDQNWSLAPVLPEHYKVSYEEPEIMGRFYRTYQVRNRRGNRVIRNLG
jgi:hypothetical protein